MTRVDLAREIRAVAARRGLRSGCDKARVLKWEAKGVTPDPDSQEYIAEVFGVPPEDVGITAWPNWLPDAGVIPLGPTSTVPAMREAMRASMDRTRRRAVLSAISGTALIALSGAWASTDSWLETAERADDTRIGEDVVALLEDTGARLAALATQERQHTAPLIDAHLATVTDLIADGRYAPQLGVRLHALAASLSQTAAWHRFDYGRHGEAARYWVAGLHSAHAIGDRDMGAALLSDLAYQASWRGDPQTAVHILERALTRTHHPAAQSLLHLRLARALAAQGDRRSTLRSIAAAEQLLGAPAADPVPAWCSWLSEADLAVDSGQCLADLGDIRRADGLIEEGQALLPGSRDKTRGVFAAYRARTYLDLGEPDLAAAAASESLELAQRIGAPRCVELVRSLTPRFETFREAEGVSELLARAAA
ncbi:XRE family transcriptional regulator [Streptomyces sp. UH6]|uniref:XRE family transcriptional regulator n=1 Tax=Streptomyces sp. UH6 TaxID=2748379 RepID=UPI001C5528FA|nr:XRE family transcriptional regulator [Streptomyces sp. UH6]